MFQSVLVARLALLFCQHTFRMFQSPFVRKQFQQFLMSSFFVTGYSGDDIIQMLSWIVSIRTSLFRFELHSVLHLRGLHCKTEVQTPLLHLPTMDLGNVKRDFRRTKVNVWKEGSDGYIHHGHVPLNKIKRRLK